METHNLKPEKGLGTNNRELQLLNQAASPRRSSLSLSLPLPPASSKNVEECREGVHEELLKVERTTREKEKSLLLSFSMPKNCFGNSDLFQSTFAFTWKREKNRQDSRERVCKGERGGKRERERERR